MEQLDNPRTVRLGEKDIVRIGLGTNRLTHTPGHVAFIREAVAAGVQLVDTAHLYTGGQSEQTVGEAGATQNPGVVVATKGGYAPGDGRPEVLRQQVEQSLRALKTDTIELYYLHRVHPETPLVDSVGALKDAVDRGQIRHVGLSEVSVDQIERARRIVPIAAVQNHYNLSERRWDDVVDYTAREGIVFVPFYPLRGEGGPELTRIAERHGATMAQVALAWLLRRSSNIAPIPGTLSVAHVRENLAALDLALTDEEFERLG
jgi:aryl-alcohol dehydrogenase-like predicted oxidoreductase